MILTVLVGNTNTRICVLHGRRPALRRIVATHDLVKKPADFLPSKHRLQGAALASVVPRATARLARAIRNAAGLKPFVLDETSETGLRFRYDRRQLGVDRVCVTVGGRAKYPGDLVVIDFGTAVTVNVLTGDGVFLGGPILPSQELMLEALHQATARLPLVRPGRATQLLSRNTRAAMLAGSYQLLCLGLEAMVRRIEAATGRSHTVIATGGGAERMKPQMPCIRRVEPDLGCLGLAELFRLNLSCGGAAARRAQQV